MSIISHLILESVNAQVDLMQNKFASLIGLSGLRHRASTKLADVFTLSCVLRLPEYYKLAENDGLWTLAPGEEESYYLLQSMLEDFLPAFSSRTFNMNMDEAYDIVRVSPVQSVRNTVGVGCIGTISLGFMSKRNL